ncbi:uncharacterized protein B0P05DRAFT_32574 [Gilbertella persicaria]|uniref:uncharacterized protein n=1 Tax=Gilbertella persicaria TaxID=101096 RepID=UPI0022210664|nr:uncharacterized protein B0P05DRAFT_32574 [Gilbertella persicaria]KAI8084240.1 hypothetical protein B0P05DRAFT_32574 [Gilbertella persicaria]
MLLFPLIKKPFKVPSSLIHLTGELHGTFEKQDDYGHTNGLYSLFLACKLSPRMTDRLFQYASEWTHNTLFLYKHPFEASFVQRLLEHVLHPQHYSSVSTEYPHLLQHFLGQLYDSFDCYTLLRDYEHYEPQASLLPIIQKLNQQDMRLFYSVLYTVQLLKNQKKECLDKEDRYYATSLIKVLQGLKNWHQLSHSGRYVSYAALRKTVKSLSASELYYPLLITPDSISERALSVLTLFYMCLACDKKDPFVYDSLKRFILQIMEGLIDNPSRQQFAKMVQQQPKSRITHWKKKSKSGDYVATMKIRPLFVPEEQALLSPVFIQDLFQTQLTQQKDTLYFI